MVNQQKLEDIADNYTFSTGINTRICRIKNSQVVECINCTENLPEICKFLRSFYCGENHSSGKCTSICEKHCRYGGHQARKLGREYIHFCPFGLARWTVPVFDQKETKSYLIGGPVLIHRVDELLLKDIINQIPALQNKKEHLTDLLEKLKVINTFRVRHLAVLLMRLSENIMEQSQLKKAKNRHTFSNISSQMVAGYQKLNDDDSFYPLEKERELISKIRLGDRKGARKLLNEILGFIYFQHNRKFNLVRLRVIELLGVLSRAALKTGADLEQIFGLEYKYLETVENISDIHQLSAWLSEVVEKFITDTFSLYDRQNSELISGALNYIRQNYQKDLSLKEVASEAGLSAGYFSKLFKKETDMTFTEYLNQVRIEKSKRLLHRGHSLAYTAQQSGFNDQSYYSKVFKKLTGTTPGSWKKS